MTKIVRGGVYKLIAHPQGEAGKISQMRPFIGQLVTVAGSVIGPADKPYVRIRLPNGEDGWCVYLFELQAASVYGFGKWFKEHNHESR